MAFVDCDRKDNFSYEGLGALFDWFEEWEENSKTEMELNVIALCCEFTEYANLAEFHQSYNKEDYETLDDINDAMIVIMVNDERFIIQNF